jgi:membrane protease subunit HflK
MYTDTMQQIYGNVTKVLVDSKQGSNLLYLPLDKIMQQVSSVVPPALDAAPVLPSAGSNANTAVDTRSRDLQRSRDRDPR